MTFWCQISLILWFISFIVTFSCLLSDFTNFYKISKKLAQKGYSSTGLVWLKVLCYWVRVWKIFIIYIILFNKHVITLWNQKNMTKWDKNFDNLTWLHPSFQFKSLKNCELLIFLIILFLIWQTLHNIYYSPHAGQHIS